MKGMIDMELFESLVYAGNHDCTVDMNYEIDRIFLDVATEWKGILLHEETVLAVQRADILPRLICKAVEALEDFMKRH